MFGWLWELAGAANIFRRRRKALKAQVAVSNKRMQVRFNRDNRYPKEESVIDLRVGDPPDPEVPTRVFDDDDPYRK